MSYCRVSGECDAYIYHDDSRGLICLGCALLGDSTPSFYAAKGGLIDMLGHIEDHRERGHRIPSEAVRYILRDLEEEQRRDKEKVVSDAGVAIKCSRCGWKGKAHLSAIQCYYCRDWFCPTHAGEHYQRMLDERSCRKERVVE